MLRIATGLGQEVDRAEAGSCRTSAASGGEQSGACQV